MRNSRSLFFGPPLAVAMFGALAFPSGCTTSGTLPSVKGSGSSSDGGASDAAFAVACIFDELDSFTCPGEKLASSGWVGRCVDDDDCTTRVNGMTANAGCTQTTEYANVTQVQMSCTTWAQGGGVLPTDDAGPTAACAPGSVSAFAPTWHPPRTMTSACTKAQIDSYLACLTDAQTTLDPATCSEWTSSPSATDQACLTCLLSNETDSSYGPLIQLPTELLINVAGCIALAEGKADGSGCGGALQTDEECQRAACLPTCPTSTSAQAEAEVACESSANGLAEDGGSGGVCATYAAAATCAGAILEGLDGGTPAEQACFGGADAGASGQFEAVALAFCGP